MSTTRSSVVLVLSAIALVFVLLFGLIAGFKSFERYQKRADAKNQVKVTAIQIRNQQQRVKIAKQHAQIRYQNSIGIREAQDEIAKTLTPLYVQFEMTQALQQIALSGKNNTIIYLPTDPKSGLPVVPTSNAVAPPTSK
jgi:leucyl aminopeptidase